jgi:hypothetical protein
VGAGQEPLVGIAGLVDEQQLALEAEVRERSEHRRHPGADRVPPPRLTDTVVDRDGILGEHSRHGVGIVRIPGGLGRIVGCDDGVSARRWRM